MKAQTDHNKEDTTSTAASKEFSTFQNNLSGRKKLKDDNLFRSVDMSSSTTKK